MIDDRIKLLYVEDDELDRMALKRFIKVHQLPYIVDFAVSVHDARIKLSETHYDALLVDYNLGDGTAFDIIQEIDTIAVVLLTGLGDEQIAAQSIKFGAFDYLIKDTNGHYLEKLPEIIEQAISVKVASIKFQAHHQEIEHLVAQRTHELLLEIDERKKAEEALHEMNEALEERVKRRTEMLTNSVVILTETQNQLIESERIIAVNRLMNNLSQKINTPVGTNITLTTFLIEETQGIINALQNNTLNKNQLVEYLTQTSAILLEVKNNLDISASLVKRFKSFNKRKLMDEASDFNLYELLNEVLMLLETKLSDHGIQVSVDIPKQLAPHNLPNVLRHIFFNMIMHAIANHGETVKPYLKISALTDDNLLKITFCDNFMPLSESELKEVLDIFYVLNHGESSKYIELNTVYSLMHELEQGSISVTIPAGGGNCITLLLPYILIETNSDLDLDNFIHK